MAIFRDGGELSGMVGNLVVVQMKNKKVLRMAPRKRSHWSEKQKQTWKRFRAQTEFWNRLPQVHHIWKIADEGNRGINFFIKTNNPAFGPEGEIIDLERLHFSAGKLPLPHRFTAVRSLDDQGKIVVSWDNDPQPGLGRDNDELMMIATLDGEFKGPVNTAIRRKAGTAEISLPQGFEIAQAIYLSFASEKRGFYSDDQFFGI